MCDKAPDHESIMSIMTVTILLYQSFCNAVCNYGHANKASCCCSSCNCCLDINVSQRTLAIVKSLELPSANT